MLTIVSKFQFFNRCGYTPHKKQQEIHQSDQRFRVVAAGARGGKSFAAGAEAAFLAIQPDKRIWIVGSKYELADKEFDWALHFLSQYEIRPGVRWIDLASISSPKKGTRIISFPWGSFIKTKSTEKPDGLLGDELDLIVLAEASQIPREPWERMLKMRLTTRRGRLLAISTPNMDSKLFEELYGNGLAGEKHVDGWQSWQFTSLDNPSFSRDEYERMRRELPPEIFAEQCEGKFVSRRGKVFPIEQRHIVEDLPQGWQDWPVLCGIQKGFKNAFVCLWSCIQNSQDRKNRKYIVFSEIYEKEKLLPDLAREILDRSKGKRILANITDYFDDSFRSDLPKHGIAVTTPYEKGLAKNQALVKRVQLLQKVFFAKENQKIFIHKSCENLIRELQSCTWPDKRREESGQPEAEIPLLANLQAPLALSYVMTFLEPENK